MYARPMRLAGEPAFGGVASARTDAVPASRTAEVDVGEDARGCAALFRGRASKNRKGRMRGRVRRAEILLAFGWVE